MQTQNPKYILCAYSENNGKVELVKIEEFSTEEKAGQKVYDLRAEGKGNRFIVLKEVNPVVNDSRAS